MTDRFSRLRGLGSKFFGTSRTGAQKASLALARILSQRDLELLPFQEGVQESKRRDKPRQISMGMWIVPFTGEIPLEEVSLEDVFPAVSCDLRREGIGVLVSSDINAPGCIVAIADKEEVWRFFSTTICHRTPRPGSWLQIGLHVDGLLEPTGGQMQEFLHAVATISGIKPMAAQIVRY